MNTNTSAGSQNAWAMIEKEKRRDRLLRRVSVAAWTVVFIIAVLFTIVTGLSVAQFMKAAVAGELPWMTVLGTTIPLFTVLLTLSVLVATLSTVGIFLRLRTASLSEIQLRLAALEDMLSARSDANG